jgi:sigma-B regulation protein RsbU (phosphoserine phosphatase)
MKSDQEKTKEELIEELKDLRTRFEERTLAFEQECLDRDQTAEALRMAKVIIDNSPAILFRRSAGDDRRLIYVSDNVRQLGYTAEEFLSARIHFREIVHPDDFERVRREIINYAEKDVEEYTQVYRFLTKNGDVRWVEDQTSVVRDADGNKTHNQGILVDITERKRAEEELRKSEEKFRRIVETAGEGFLLMDENLHIMDVNDAYCRLLGYTREEILGKTPLDLATEEFRQFMETNRISILSKE